jgi:MoxR-like ATPase
MEAVHRVHVSETFVEHVVALVNRSRHHPHVELGCSPRAGIALVKAARARALMHGRHYAIPEDLFALAEDVMLHRMRLSYEALADGRPPGRVAADPRRDRARRDRGLARPGTRRSTRASSRSRSASSPTT